MTVPDKGHIETPGMELRARLEDGADCVRGVRQGPSSLLAEVVSPKSVPHCSRVS